MFRIRKGNNNANSLYAGVSIFMLCYPQNSNNTGPLRTSQNCACPVITCSAVILYADWSIDVRPGAIHILKIHIERQNSISPLEPRL